MNGGFKDTKIFWRRQSIAVIDGRNCHLRITRRRQQLHLDYIICQITPFGKRLFIYFLHFRNLLPGAGLAILISSALNDWAVVTDIDSIVEKARTKCRMICFMFLVIKKNVL